MSSTQNVSFGGKIIVTTVTKKAVIIDEWIEKVMNDVGGRSTVVGLDIEWRPNVVSTLSNKSATLQLCIDTKCLIVQLFYLDYIPESLRNFMGRPNFTFVGVQVGEDVEKLVDEYGIACGSTKDIQAHAMENWPRRWYRRPGLKTLACDIVGLHMPKPMHVCRSDWQARVLSVEQVEYASIDAYASYMIGRRFFM